MARKLVASRPRAYHFFFLSGRWDNADPAAVFESFPVRPSRRTFDAALPAFSLVCSFLAMTTAPNGRDVFPHPHCKTRIYRYSFLHSDEECQLIDIRKAILAALKKELLLDLEDQLRAAALEASKAGAALPMNAKRRREAEGQIRFRLQEERYEEVVQQHGGYLLPDGVMWGTDLKVFQPFARFPGSDTAIILGFASMSEPRKIPPKNQSRAAGVTLNVSLQASLFDGDDCPKATDIFVLFLTARDRRQAGMLEEIAIGVIGADYEDFIFYASLDDFIQGYESNPALPGGPDGPDGGAKVKLRPTRKRFVPPEQQPDTEVGEE